MKPFYRENGITLYQGDCRDVLRTLPEKSVNCCVTSPPYFGLRDYGVAGQIGLEPTPAEYVANMISVFREVRRVLRDDGTVFLNLGDSYASALACSRRNKVGNGSPDADTKRPDRLSGDLKEKDLIGIPWAVAFALRADGWYLRADNVWGKPNGMPESVRDRTTRAHEYVFHLSKSERYYYDAEAVRTPPAPSTETRLAQDIESQLGSVRANGGAKTNGTMKAVGRMTDKQRGHSRRHAGFNERWDQMERDEQVASGANLRSVWWISPAQFAKAHFAVMPPKLATICILAGCPDGGTVLDCFNGAGTTGVVCRQQHVKYIGIELNPEYCGISVKRWAQTHLPFTDPPLPPIEAEDVPDQLPMFRPHGDAA